MVQSLVNRLLGIVNLRTPRRGLAQATAALLVTRMGEEDLPPATLQLAEAAAEATLSAAAVTPTVVRVAQSCLAGLAVQRGDRAAAVRMYPALQPARGTIIHEGMAADRLLGLLAGTMGDHGAAREHFEDALRFCRTCGARPELAWSAYNYASLLCRLGEPGDRARARKLRDEALTIADELGMRPLRERVLSLSV
jgi:hypothetical protein